MYSTEQWYFPTTRDFLINPQSIFLDMRNTLNTLSKTMNTFKVNQQVNSMMLLPQFTLVIRAL